MAKQDTVLAYAKKRVQQGISSASATANPQAYGEYMWSSLMAMEEAIERKGFPPMSDFWKDSIKAFYLSKKLRFVARVGRRGGKSSTLTRVAVNEAVFGQHEIPPGDTGKFAFVSVIKEEAQERLATIRAILDVLGIAYESKGFVIRLRDKPIVFSVYPCSYRTAVGFTCIGLICDELARWRDEDTGANPASQVLSSIRPSMRTQRKAKEFLISSPWSTLDAHYDHVEQGDTNLQMVVSAPTWVANPTVTERECREAEEDEEAFLREYAALPMKSGASYFFDHNALEQSVSNEPFELQPGDEIIAGADFGFTRDFSALALCAIRDNHYHVFQTHVIKPQPGQALKPSETVSAFASIVKPFNISGIICDRHYQESITEHLAPYNIGFIAASNDVATNFVRARTLLHQGRVSLPDIPTLLRDLKETRSRPTRTGRVTILLPRRPGGGHADLVSAIVLALQPRGGLPLQGPEKPFPDNWTKEELDEAKEYARDLRRDRIGYDGSHFEEPDAWFTE